MRRCSILFITTVLFGLMLTSVAGSKPSNLNLSLSSKAYNPCTPAYLTKKRCSAPTTVDQTIGDFDNDNRLERGPGDPYVVRTDLGRRRTKPASKRGSSPLRLLTLAQISDFQTLDEESPLRVEDIDDVNIWGLGDNVLGSAYRPQESLGLQVANSVVETLNSVRSPVSNARPQLAFTTGDNADNMQENETEWYIDVLDGDTVDPNSGNPELTPGDCLPPYPNDLYQGVRDGGSSGWYEPDGDNLAGKSEGLGYSSDAGKNLRDVERNVASRNFPGLFEAAQRRFAATGLNIPWLTVFGNHDALVWGNFKKNQNAPPYFRDNEDFATGCEKDLNGNYWPWFDLDPVQPDDKRHLLNHDEWIMKHFDSPSSPGPVGHGFSTDQPNRGFYTYPLAGNLRLISLDSVNRDGLSNGIIRDGRLGAAWQFEWLNEQLDLANEEGEKVIVVAHHSLRTMNNTDTFGWEDQHCGLIDSPEWPQPGAKQCNDLDPDDNKSLEALFYEKGNVIAYIAGHEHDNNIEPRREQGGPGRFWEITTVSEVDWPQQSSLIDIYDNRDGTWSIFRTLVDHASRLDPGNSPNLNDPRILASISRELSFNDPQGQTGEDNTIDRRGEPEDRNVELILDVNP